jgi:hypothetical protein
MNVKQLTQARCAPGAGAGQENSLRVMSRIPNRIPARHQLIAVVFDFVDPLRPGGRTLGGRGKARFNTQHAPPK